MSILSNGIHESVVVYNVDDIYKYMAIFGFIFLFSFWRKGNNKNISFFFINVHIRYRKGLLFFVFVFTKGTAFLVELLNKIVLLVPRYTLHMMTFVLFFVGENSRECSIFIFTFK